MLAVCLLTLSESRGMPDLQAEIDTVKRTINLCKQKIAGMETPVKKIDLTSAVLATADYVENFRAGLIARKNRKAA